jgi:glycosyltransferase involved in cell wall biosynthesis
MNPEHISFLKQYVKGMDDPFKDDFYRRFWTRDISKYGTHYENVDVLLAPLKENDFNYVKSQLKVIEAGFTGTAIIAENYGPYTIDLVPYLEKGNVVNEEGNALLVDPSRNHKQWAKYIKYLVENPDVVTKMQDNLRKMVIERYSLENVCKDRVKLYKSIVGL